MNSLVTTLPGLLTIFVSTGGVNALAGVLFKKESQTDWRFNNLEIDKKNPETTWKLINELNFRNVSSHKSNSNIKVGEEIINTPRDVAETFNNHFASLGEKLASDVPISTVEPDVYIVPVETTFLINYPSMNAVYRKLKTLNIGKAAGQDQIPCISSLVKNCSAIADSNF